MLIYQYIDCTIFYRGMKMGYREHNCRKCGMPMLTEETEGYGTDTRGSKSMEYCRFCLRDGKFIKPQDAKEDMTQKVTEYLKTEMMIEEENARKKADTIVLLLRKKWKTNVAN